MPSFPGGSDGNTKPDGFEDVNDNFVAASHTFGASSSKHWCIAEKIKE